MKARTAIAHAAPERTARMSVAGSVTLQTGADPERKAKDGC
jgi:hypothetical protein